MFHGQRVGKNAFTRPLNFHNPFRTSYYTNPLSKVFVGPIVRDGITSLEREEKKRVLLHLQQMRNAGILKEEGVDMEDFMGDSVALPSGVTSLKEAEREGDVARKMQQFNAGILNSEQRAQKLLSKYAKKQKEAELRKRVVQYFAESEELEDDVPAEYREAVADYYAANPSVKDKVMDKRRKLKEKKDKKAKDEREAFAYWNPTNPFNNVVPMGVGKSTEHVAQERPTSLTMRLEDVYRQYVAMTQKAGKRPMSYQQFLKLNGAPPPPPSGKYTGPKTKVGIGAEAADDMFKAFKDGADDFHTFLEYAESMYDPSTDDYNPMEPLADYYEYWNDDPEERDVLRQRLKSQPQQQAAAAGSGWRAPMLHNLVRPLKRFEINQTPDKIIEEQKEALDERRDMYKDLQENQRGAPPPKGMVERAMPKLAAPLFTERKVIQNLGIVPHPFIFRKKKYALNSMAKKK